MTDQTGTKAKTGQVWIAAGEDARSIVSGLLPLNRLDTVVMLPSSLSRRDALASVLRQALRAQGTATHLEIPGNPLAGLSRLARGGGTWREMTIAPPDRDRRSIHLPASLLDAGKLWVVIDVDAVSGRGPYALDLLSRYVDPLSRVRHLGTRERVSEAVEVNLARTPDQYVMVKDAGDFVLGATTGDPVVAELLALSLADEDLTRDHRVTGPWEDPMVQRATELELGARIPGEIQVEVSGHRNRASDETIVRILARIGVRWP